MIRFMRSAHITAGNFIPALQFAKEMGEYVTRYDGVDSVEVLYDCFGDVGTIRWFVDYPDLATLEEVQRQLVADEKYWNRLLEEKDLFIVDSIQDIVLRTI